METITLPSRLENHVIPPLVDMKNSRVLEPAKSFLPSAEQAVALQLKAGVLFDLHETPKFVDVSLLSLSKL